MPLFEIKMHSVDAFLARIEASDHINDLQIFLRFYMEDTRPTI